MIPRALSPRKFMAGERLPDGILIAKSISEAIVNGEIDPTREAVEVNLLRGFWESGQHARTPEGFVDFVNWIKGQKWDDDPMSRVAVKVTVETLSERAKQQWANWTLEFEVHPQDQKAVREASFWSTVYEVTRLAVYTERTGKTYRSRY